MRNLKKFLALILAFMMTFSLMVTVNASGDFTDSEQINEKFSEAVTVLEGLGVFKGYENGDDVVFKPTENITRAEVAAIVYRLATGDAEENQTHLYVDGSKFTDVVPTDWYAGVVGYCANANLILGYGNGKFGPNDNVTGVQALTMILRAVGYGQGGEFQGAGWETNAYSRARSEGLLKNVDSTNYAAKLSQPATRELIAELLFQAAQIPTVTWTQALGYNKYSSLLGQDSDLNDSLGEKFFGLTSDTGIIVGNQATGEKNTKVSMNVYAVMKDTQVLGYRFDSVSYEYASGTPAADATNNNVTLEYDFETGLDEFGHKVTVWYNNKTAQGSEPLTGSSKGSATVGSKFAQVYAVFDQATRVDMVYEDVDQNLASGGELNKAVKAAGFSIRTAGANVSDAFSAMSGGPVTIVPNTNGTSNVYLLISNSGAKGDETNALDLVVSLEVGLTTVTAKNDYTSPKNVTFASGGTVDRSPNATSFATMLVYGEESVKVNNFVVLNEIFGTGTEFGNTPAMDELFGINSITEKVEGKITSIASDGTVTLADGKKVAASALWETTLTPKASRGNGNLLIGNTVTLHLDNFGKYVRVTAGSADELMGAYAYWQQEGIDGVKYYLQGVTEEGKIITKEITQDAYNTTFAKQEAGSIPIHHMRNSIGADTTDPDAAIGVGGNLVIVAPDDPAGFGYVDYAVDADGNVGSAGWLPLSTSMNKDTRGLRNGDRIDFFSDETVFHVVTGWGSTLKVETYTGMTALLKGAGSVVADGYYFTSRDDTEQSASKNNVIDTVLLVNTRWIQPNSFVYVGNNVPTDSAATKDGKAHQFQVYAVGQDTETSILVADDPAGTPFNFSTEGPNTFYIFDLTSEGYYQLIADPMDWTEFGIGQAKLDRSTTNGGTAFGDIKITDGVNSFVVDAENATVLDVTGTNHGITNYETLRRAAERNDIIVDILLTSMGGDTASVIYVTSVTPI